MIQQGAKDEEPVKKSAIALLAFTALVAGAASPAPKVTVYKLASCGCCAQWVQHLREHGYQVTTEDVADVAPIKQKYHVPDAVASCHTALVGGYVVEGHVPADVISKMLRERPKIAGIGVPGMPQGAPGMESPTPQHYDVLSFDTQGHTAVYAKR